MTTTIRVPADVGDFAEDKDRAREIRTTVLLPALEAGDDVVLEFSEVGYATQSFVHALIGEGLSRYGENFLNRVAFRGCGPQVRNIVALVVDYSLGGFEPAEGSTQANGSA